MLKWITRFTIPLTHYSEKQIREIIERDLPTHHLKRKAPPRRKHDNSDAA